MRSAGPVTQASETRIKYIYHTGCKSSSTKYNPTMINLYAYHDDAAEEVPSNPSYTNHASTTVMTPCAVRHRRGERHKRAWLIFQPCCIGSWTDEALMHANAIYIYTNTMHGDVKRRLTTTTNAA
jgi:hypothetical protein